jgi:hypothetical protein
MRAPARPVFRSSRIWGVVVLVLMILVAIVLIDPRAKPIPEIRRLRALLASQHIACDRPQYWWSYPKGRSVLNCTRFEIDVFNNHAEVTTFVHRRNQFRHASVLRRFGVSSYLVIGPRWLLITPSERIASRFASISKGRILQVSRG